MFLIPQLPNMTECFSVGLLHAGQMIPNSIRGGRASLGPRPTVFVFLFPVPNQQLHTGTFLWAVWVAHGYRTGSKEELAVGEITK